VSKIATALMFGCAIVLASDASFARARFRMSSPPSPSKAAVQPAKPATVQASKPGTQKPGAAEPQRPFAAAPRPGSSTFVNINARPFAAAPAAAPAQRAISDGADHGGPLRYDPVLGLVPVNGSVSAKELAPDQAKEEAAANPSTSEQPSVQAASTNVRMASPSMPAPSKKSAPVTGVCYVQLSGACVPF
jgi:hypothetical protein